MIVLNNKGQLLLHQREDFRIWALPGGKIEPGEGWEAVAVREVYEETGYQVEVKRLVGEYWQPYMANLKYVCTAAVVGGAPITRGPETLQVRWFDLERLPFSFPRLMREYIQDAGAHHPLPLKKSQSLPWWQASLMKGLFKLRDWRNRRLNKAAG